MSLGAAPHMWLNCPFTVAAFYQHKCCLRCCTHQLYASVPNGPNWFGTTKRPWRWEPTGPTFQVRSGWASSRAVRGLLRALWSSLADWYKEGVVARMVGEIYSAITPGCLSFFSGFRLAPSSSMMISLLPARRTAYLRTANSVCTHVTFHPAHPIPTVRTKKLTFVRRWFVYRGMTAVKLHLCRRPCGRWPQSELTLGRSRQLCAFLLWALSAGQVQYLAWSVWLL